VTANVTMKDGRELPLLDHLRDGHQKGTQGYTEQFLINLHKTLHQPDRDSAPEHEQIRDDEPADTDAARDEDEAPPGR
jgi:hypothetical protein